MMPEAKLKLSQSTPNSYHFKTKDDHRVDIEYKNKGIALELHKWGNEASLEIDLNMVKSGSHQFLNNRIEIDTPTAKLRAYPIDARSTAEFYGDSDDMVQCEDGGLRFELVLKGKPLFNSFTIPIKSKNLRFSYQPFLTEQDIADGISRPLNVEGSYAVYHATKKNNQFMTGKAFHIYRPIAEDALGNKAWCSLHIDGYIDPKNLTITVPQQFLDEAVYPVTIDPDFGYSTIGSSIYHIANGAGSMRRRGSAWPMSAGGGTANYIRARIFDNLNDNNCDCKVFINQKDSGGAGTHGQIATKENLACSKTEHWEEFTLSSEALTGGVVYILNILGGVLPDKSDYYHVRGDEDGAVASYTALDTYATPESPWVEDPEVTTKDYSIYCDYTETAPPAKPHTFRLDTRPHNRMSFHPNLKLG